MGDTVNHPGHYNQHPAGIECIDVIEAFPYNIAVAIKYLWRCDFKGDAVKDLRKAAWHIGRELERRGWKEGLNEVSYTVQNC